MAQLQSFVVLWKETFTYITVVDYQVRLVVLVVVCLKEGEVRVRHTAIVKTMTQS
jgi:hypothetical protein